jgi:tetratricopeptide (TPR) repeat protein
MENVNEIIEKYIDGDLEDSKVQWFNDELKSNPSFVKLYQLHCDINKAIGEEDILEMRKNLKKIYLQNFSFERKTFFNHWYKYAIAASVIIILGLGTLFFIINKSYTASEVYAMYYKPYEPINIVRSENVLQDDLTTKAMSAYAAEQYELSYKLFNQIIDEKQYDSLSFFYSALSAMELHKYNDAIIRFNSIIEQPKNIFTTQSQWYLGLCYLALGNTEKAKQTFNIIIATDGYNKEIAKKIVKYKF